MRLQKLIDRLTEIKDKHGPDIGVSVMDEVPGLQVQHNVRDVAYSSRSGVIIIGQEIRDGKPEPSCGHTWDHETNKNICHDCERIS